MNVTARQVRRAEELGSRLRAEFNAKMDAMLTPRERLKICRVCKLEKNVKEFAQRGETKDGYDSRCQSCVSEYRRRRKAHRHRKGRS